MSSVPPPFLGTALVPGRRVVRWRLLSQGSTRTLRWIVWFDDGRSAFVKVATNPLTAQWLRTECQVYRSARADFLPELIGWRDDGRRPVLVLEDLSAGHWPPPWTAGAASRVLDVLKRVWRTECAVTRSFAQTKRIEPANWRRIRASPAGFLSLGLCSRAWLDMALPVLEAAEAAADFRGSDLLHGDVKGGNVCLLGDRTVLVDWNWAARGNGLLDVAAWLPSLNDEGGPAPETVLRGEAPLAAAVAGGLAFRASQPAPMQFPQLRVIQIRKLRCALPWVCRTLNISIP